MNHKVTIPRAAVSAAIRRQEYAESLGFATGQEMMECLSLDWKPSAIADLIGVHVATIRNWKNLYGIPQNPVGGKNHIKKSKVINGVKYGFCPHCEDWYLVEEFRGGRKKYAYCLKCRHEYLRIWRINRKNHGIIDQYY